MFAKVLLLVFVLKQCEAVIRDLNETEYARMPRLFELDDYRSCLRPAGGIYCAFKLELYPGKNEELMDMIREYSDYKYKHYNHTYLEKGVCASQTCAHFLQNVTTEDNNAVRAALEACENQSLYENYGLEGKISDLYYCDRHGQKEEVDNLDIFVAVLLILLLVSNVVGTVYHVLAVVEESKANKVLMSFSLVKNWEELVRPDLVTPYTKHYKGLNGLRVIAICMTLLAHIMYGSVLFSENPDYFEKGYNLFPQKMIVGGLPLVQLFFAISGFFLSHGLEIFSETNKLSLAIIPKVITMRWVRLSPGYFLLILVMATWVRFIDTGPLWNLYAGSNGAVSHCRQYMWYHIFYINNYVPEDTHCAVQTWHIATDFQLFCFGLFVYVATKPKLRIPLLSALFTIGLVIPTYHMWRDNLDPVTLVTPEAFRTLITPTFRYLHTYGHNNLPAFIAGMIAGIMVFRWQKQGLDLSKKFAMGLCGWLIVPYIIALFIYSFDWQAENSDPDFFTKFMFGTVTRLLLCIVVVYIIIGISMNIPNKLRFIIEWDGWLIPCRLSYSAYIVQAIFIYHSLGTRQRLTYVSYNNLIRDYCGFVTLIFLASIPYYLLLEAPINKLLKAWLKRGQKQKKAVPKQETNEETKDANANIMTYPEVHRDQNGTVNDSYQIGKAEASFRESLLNNVVKDEFKKIN